MYFSTETFKDAFWRNILRIFELILRNCLESSLGTCIEYYFFRHPDQKDSRNTGLNLFILHSQTNK